MRLLTLATQAVCVAIVMMTGLFAEANVFSSDRRQDLWPVPVELQPIGVLRSIPDDGGWGTAFLIGECHILTAHHVAFPNAGKNGITVTKEMKSTFYVGRTQTGHRGEPEGFAAKATATPVHWGAYTTKNYTGLTHDWAILKLDSCLGRHYGVMNMFPRIAVHKQRVTVVSLAGYPRDRMYSPGISFESNCNIREVGPEVLLSLDCAFATGASGGPVLENNDGAYHVMGLAIRRMRPVEGVLPAYSEEHRNIIVSTDQLLSTILNLK